MKPASLTAPLKCPQNIWQWLCLLSLVCLGWVSVEQLSVMFAEADDGALLVYDRDGNGVIYLPDHLAGRPQPFGSLSFDFAQDGAISWPWTWP